MRPPTTVCFREPPEAPLQHHLLSEDRVKLVEPIEIMHRLATKSFLGAKFTRRRLCLSNVHLMALFVGYNPPRTFLTLTLFRNLLKSSFYGDKHRERPFQVPPRLMA